MNPVANPSSSRVVSVVSGPGVAGKAGAAEVRFGLPGLREADEVVAVSDGVRELLEQLVDAFVALRRQRRHRPRQIRSVVIHRKPPSGFEPLTPSLRVKCSTS